MSDPADWKPKELTSRVSYQCPGAAADAPLNRLGRVENAIRSNLSAGMGILKVAAIVGAASGTVQGVKREMAAEAG